MHNTIDDNSFFRLSEVYISVYAVQSSGLMTASQYLGWGYVFAWGINKLPLMYTIIKTKRYAQNPDHMQKNHLFWTKGKIHHKW